jgi:hypothetical protein
MRHQVASNTKGVTNCQIAKLLLTPKVLQIAKLLLTPLVLEAICNTSFYKPLWRSPSFAWGLTAIACTLFIKPLVLRAGVRSA